ncbi:hypothetical protein ACFDTO_04850 [Microbacteriaceae bacterium 4G12]
MEFGIDTTSLVETFWVPVSALVPVIALALVLELRYAFQHDSGPSVLRILRALLGSLGTGILVLVENFALWAMAQNEPYEPLVFPTIMLIGMVFTAVALNPLLAVLIDGLWSLKAKRRGGRGQVRPSER